MGRYEFSLQQEVLLEKGAAVLGDLFQYKRQKQIVEETHPVSVMYSLIWAAKQDILIAKTEAALEQIEGQFNLASRFLAEAETGKRSDSVDAFEEQRNVSRGIQ